MEDTNISSLELVEFGPGFLVQLLVSKLVDALYILEVKGAQQGGVGVALCAPPGRDCDQTKFVFAAHQVNSHLFEPLADFADVGSEHAQGTVGLDAELEDDEGSLGRGRTVCSMFGRDLGGGTAGDDTLGKGARGWSKDLLDGGDDGDEEEGEDRDGGVAKGEDSAEHELDKRAEREESG